jgi:formylglycine-generating enzyme required for sulfatase activity
MCLWRQAGGAVGNPPRRRASPASEPNPVLTAEGYLGLEALLSRHAEEVLRDVTAKNPDSGKVVEYLFRAITEVDAEGHGIRRPRRLSALVGVTGGKGPVLEQVVQRFWQPDCGFLLRSSEADPMIDIGHEALIRCWNALDDPTIDETSHRPRGWLQREQEDERIWRSMLVQAESGDRISPAVLKDREAWFASLPGADWAEQYDGGWDRINELLTSSRNAARLGRGVRIGAAISTLLFAAVSSWWVVGVTPRDGLLMLGLRVGLVDPSPTMIELPAGSFQMGSTEAERQWVVDQGIDRERVEPEAPRHDVEIKQPFAIGKYEVTFDDWDLCVADGGCNGYRPGDEGWGRGRRPVIAVSWQDAKAYIEWLSEETGQSYRLPSEAEWEYAARAGTTSYYWWGDELPTPEQANFGKHVGKTKKVGTYPANPRGLHDMNGNLYEWVEDCWHKSYKGAPHDGTAWTRVDCSRRGLRGGAWSSSPEFLRSALRNNGAADVRSTLYGFRIARTLSDDESVAP